MILFPNAKINLGLYVTARRSDGYHEIATVMYPIGWTDILEITPAPDSADRSTLTVTGREVTCSPEKNLVMKALRSFERYIGRSVKVDIHLHKIIPDGAGLGGGSADAAFTIVGLNRLTQVDLSTEEMEKIASEVGADCPFFIQNRPMLATGIGTHLRPIDVTLKGLMLVVVKPDESVSTAEAYAGIQPAPPINPIEMSIARPIECWRNELFNDFEKIVFNRCTEVGKIKQQLEAMSPLYCSMSGSGSAVYALFNGDIMSVDEMRSTIADAFPQTDIFVEQILH